MMANECYVLSTGGIRRCSGLELKLRDAGTGAYTCRLPERSQELEGELEGQQREGVIGSGDGNRACWR
jgi:hypothetical protein